LLTELLLAAVMLLGVFFMFVASVGVYRLSDFYSRIHAPTKAATLGLAFLLLAVSAVVGEASVVTKAILALLFIGATAPAGAHILSRAAYRHDVPMDAATDPDEYAAVVDARRFEMRRRAPAGAADLEQDDRERIT
jgi:multicomponent Na+:H+ antiporter subunit G